VQIQKIRDDVEYYIDSNQEADFEENEFLYDELDLEDLGMTIRTDPVAASPTDSNEVESLAGSSSPPLITPPSSHSKVKMRSEFTYYITRGLFLALGWLGSLWLGHWTRDREIASSTPGRCIARYPRSAQPSIPPG